MGNYARVRSEAASSEGAALGDIGRVASPEPAPELAETRVAEARVVEATEPTRAALESADTEADEPVARGGSRTLDEVPRGTTIGRLMVLRTLGAGGMGVVYSAYDPELDRKVALKFIGAARRGSQAARTRLYREAQALAKLSHPNVVTVHDVGTHEGQVWLSMEFVAGATLGGWREAARRSWRDVLEVMIQATRGVAAAHRAGLLHRDLKPDNIMVGEDGRVRVMDFGLARAGADEPAPDRGPRSPSWQGALSLELTAAGALMGTPAYMAPEQFAGQAADERSDQYSLCATLWEALYGRPAFTGGSLMELANAVASGSPRAPSGARVPRWLRRVVERGLAVQRERRYPSVEALLAALQANPTRRRWLLGVGLGVGLACAAGVGLRHAQRERLIASCQARGASVEELWNADAEVRLRAGLLATEMPYAEAVADSVTPYFAAHAAAWRDASVETCLDEHVREEWDEVALERSRDCLDARREELEALVAELSRADAKAAERAVDAAASLPQVARCRDRLRLATTPPLPRDREAVRAFWRVRSAAMAQRNAGHVERGLELAEEAIAEAARLESAPLRAEAIELKASILVALGEYGESEGAFEDAYFIASEAGALEQAARAALGLIGVVGYRQGRHDEGLRWARQADVTLSVLGEGARGLRRAAVLNARGIILMARGESAAATEMFETALSIREEALDPTHPHVTITLVNLANVRYSYGAYDDSRALYERALAAQERVLGEDHPEVAKTLNNLAGVHEKLGARGEAKAQLERALAIRERALGPEHPAVGSVLGNLAIVYLGEGEHAKAEVMSRRSLAIKKKAHGEEHPAVAMSYHNLAGALEAAGELAEAQALYERALEMREQLLGPDSHLTASTLMSLAKVRHARGALDAARQGFERAAAIYERAFGPEHHEVAACLVGIAEVALSRGEPAAALEPAARALRILATSEAPPEYLGAGRLTLARALWSAPARQGRDRARSLELAREARDALRGVSDAGERLAAVEAFLSEHSDSE